MECICLRTSVGMVPLSTIQPTQSLSGNGPLRPVHTEQLRLQKRCRKQLGSISFYAELFTSGDIKHQRAISCSLTQSLSGNEPSSESDELSRPDCNVYKISIAIATATLSSQLLNFVQ